MSKKCKKLKEKCPYIDETGSSIHAVGGEASNCDFDISKEPILPIPYNSIPDKKLMADANHIFSTSGNCKLLSCQLLDKGCNGAYTGQNVELDGLLIKGSQNVVDGYEQEACVVCSDK